MILALYKYFLTTPFFTTSLSLLKSIGAGNNLTSNLSTLPFKMLQLVGTFFNLSIFNLSVFDFKLAKSTFLGNYDAYILMHFLNLLLFYK